VVERSTDGACNIWSACEARWRRTRIFKGPVGIRAVSNGFNFGGVELLSEWAFQLWWHLGVVVTGTMRSQKRQREVAAREVGNIRVSFTEGKSRTLRKCFWTFFYRLDCKKAEKNSKQWLPSHERVPESCQKFIGSTPKKSYRPQVCSSDTMKKKRKEYNCEINLYFLDVFFVQ
jgi:hypothetical protein